MATTKATTLAHTLGGIAGSIETAEINRLDGVNADIQTQLDNLDTAKAPKASPAFTGDSVFDTDTLKVDATNNRVGIGTASPEAHSSLHVVSSGYQPLIVNTTSAGGGGLTVRHSDTQKVYFGTGGSTHLSTSNTNDGIIRAEHDFRVATGGNNERVKIDSSGSITTPNGQFNGTIGSSATFPDYNIIQVRWDDYKDEAGSTTATHFTDVAGADFEVAITPSHQDHYILVICTAEIEMASSGCHVCMDFYRKAGTSTAINYIMSTNSQGQGAGQNRAQENSDRFVVTWSLIDHPNTDQIVRYRPTIRRSSGAGNFYIGSGSAGTNTITAMEIKL